MHRFSTKTLGFILFAAIVSLSGCKKPNPNPEFSDPIYLDLKDRAKQHEKAAEEAKAQIEAAREALEAAEPRSIEKKQAENDLQRARATLTKSEQLARYFKIRTERRKVEGRRAYRQAFEKGEEWPKPGEFEQYKTHMRLKEAPEEWGHRVPSMADRYRGVDN